MGNANRLLFLCCISVFPSLLGACNATYQPKPKAYLRLSYPTPQYERANPAPAFSFDYNTFARVITQRTQQPKIVYDTMKATVYLNYNPIKNNLDSLLNDAYRLPAKHMVMADMIDEKVYVEPKNKVFGGMFTVTGNAASQCQFYLTDSLNHFLIGSLYFYAQPNYDSILPAAKYIQNDMIRLMESLQWREQ